MNDNKNYFAIFLLLIAAVLVLFIMPKKDEVDNPLSGNGNGNNEAAVVNDFNSCLEAGFIVMESNPRQCRDDKGTLYVEDISENAEVVIDSPLRGQVVNSPLSVSGKAKGNWFFEANLPVTLKDQNGKIIAQKGAQAEGDWMTEQYVNFSATLVFEQPSTEFGVLLIQKDNPSGLPQNDAEFAIPVLFK